MFPSHQKSTGAAYTPTVALLAVAFIFTPAVLIVLHPVGLASVALAIACSVVSSAAVWINWRRSSSLSISLLEVHVEGKASH